MGRISRLIPCMRGRGTWSHRCGVNRQGAAAARDPAGIRIPGGGTGSGRMTAGDCGPAVTRPRRHVSAICRDALRAAQQVAAGSASGGPALSRPDRKCATCRGRTGCAAVGHRSDRSGRAEGVPGGKAPSCMRRRVPARRCRREVLPAGHLGRKLDARAGGEERSLMWLPSVSTGLAEPGLRLSGDGSGK
jgi:hypothetical protein